MYASSDRPEDKGELIFYFVWAIRLTSCFVYRAVANIRLDPDPILNRDHRGFLRYVTTHGRGGMDDDPDPRGGDR